MLINAVASFARFTKHGSANATTFTFQPQVCNACVMITCYGLALSYSCVAK